MIEGNATCDPVPIGLMGYDEIENLRRARIRFWAFEEGDHGASVWVEAADVPSAEAAT